MIVADNKKVTNNNEPAFWYLPSIIRNEPEANNKIAEISSTIDTSCGIPLLLINATCSVKFVILEGIALINTAVTNNRAKKSNLWLWFRLSKRCNSKN